MSNNTALSILSMEKMKAKQEIISANYFSEETIQHLVLHYGQTIRYNKRSLDITLACKLTLTYGKYHLMMLHRQLAMSEKRTSFQQAERKADMMNKMTIFHSSPTDFLHTQEQSTDKLLTFTRNTNNSWRSITMCILNQPF